MRAGLPRRARLRRAADIKTVLRGRRLRSGPVDIFLSEPDSPISRAGIIVPRHGHTAVARNRLKRRLREIVRIKVMPLLARDGMEADIVLRARPQAYEASFDELAGSVVRVIRRIDE